MNKREEAALERRTKRLKSALTELRQMTLGVDVKLTGPASDESWHVVVQRVDIFGRVFTLQAFTPEQARVHAQLLVEAAAECERQRLSALIAKRQLEREEKNK